MLKDVLLLVLGAFIGTWLGILSERVRARIAAEFWEAQERWKLKVDIYSRLLSAMRRMRGTLEAPATRGLWPAGPELERLVATAEELTEPAMLSALWLPDDVVKALATQGDRLLALKNGGTTEKTQLMEACALVQADIDRVLSIARKDLSLQRAHEESKWSFFGGGKRL